ncbi:glycosyltransferase family 4 protein [Oceanobacillus alkalisoli]|uniref:glycosyltransferase family 4 protein n=1 Tax=Oceanobacillus alkalisoli TaxID=2925113 RepID=UPI001F12101D|nr:glycosyltransferase family 4 protein [Oceanobacillus alkalisoli]MCF3942691.1 glycosyltransferase family 4 protein [Oceanobacillus alkalisoli]
MSKKVLLMTQNFYPVIGSSGNRMKNIYQLLNENGIDADVLTTEPAYPNKNMYKDSEFWDEESLNEEKYKIIRVPIKNNRFQNHILSRLFFYLEIMYRFLLELWKLRKNGYDYILVSTPPIFIVFSAFVGKFVLKSKLILEVRDLWPDSLIGVKTFHNKPIIKIFRFLEKKMYGKADSIVINSIGFYDHIKGKLKQDKPITYMPNGPRVHEITEDNPETKEFRVVYTGNLGLAQDIDHLKLVANLLHAEGIRFDVIGYGVRTEEFVNYLAENDLNTVHIHKPTTRKKSLELIKNSNVAVAFLNDEEVFSTVLPGKIIDYMTCRTPIIAGVKGTAADMITENETGFTFDQTDVEGIVAKIVELKNDKAMEQQLGENCIRTVKEYFLWENNIKKLIDIMK